MTNLKLFATRLNSLFGGVAILLVFIMCLGNVSAQENDADGDQKKWPRQIETEVGTIVIFQPQLDDLEDVILSARAAFSITKKW